VSNSPVRIHYIHEGPVPSLAANAVQVAKMCAAFQATGASVALTVPTGRAATSRDVAVEYRLSSELTIRRLPIPRIPGRQLLFGSIALMGGWSRDVIIFTRSIPVALIATTVGMPTALEMHQPPDTLRPVLIERMRRIMKRTSFLMVIVISERLKQQYEQVFPGLGDRILVAPDGADVVDVDDADVMPLTGAFKVGYVGHLYSGRGMEIIEQLAPRLSHMVFHIVGGNAADLGRWRARMSHVPNVVLHGHVPHSVTRRYLAAMDVVVAPYQRVVLGAGGGTTNLADGMSPLKIFEYMAAGKAIVASDLPALHEMLEDGHNALLCPPEDVDGWVTRLAQLEADSGLRRRLGVQGRCDLLERYTWDRRARAILTALSKALARSGRASGAVSDVRPALDFDLLRAAPQTFPNDNTGGKRHERPHCDDEKGRAEH
jgi:glycosyltransferase involved in cell wall biosynthesis